MCEKSQLVLAYQCVNIDITSTDGNKIKIEENVDVRPSSKFETDEKRIQNQEISKTTLLKLQKNSIDAQFVNAQINNFNNFISGKVMEFQRQNKVIINIK